MESQWAEKMADEMVAYSAEHSVASTVAHWAGWLDLHWVDHWVVC